MMPAKYKFLIYRGGTWNKSLAGTDSEEAAYDFSGYDKIRMQIKAAWEKHSAAKLKEFSMETGHIEIADAGQTLNITISAEETAALVFNEGKYEIELIINKTDTEVEVVHKFMVGDISVLGEVL